MVDRQPRPSSATDTGLIADLRRAVSGTVTGPTDNGFEAVSRPWSLAVDQRVRAVVEVADVADVSATVRYARAQGLSVAAQPVGHGATAALQDTILLRTAALHEMTVDAAARSARIGAGVRWQDLLPLLDKAQLVPLAGSTDGLSVVGYTLGGGQSWLGRRYGFAANAVRGFDVVDSDGRPAAVTAETDPDLFWALRGGGGDFAVVTAMAFDVFPGEQLYGGRLMWPMDRAAEVLAAYRTVTASAPDEVTVWLSLMWVPDLPMVPAPLRGQRFVVADSMITNGDPGPLGPLRDLGGTVLDTIRPLPVGEFASVSDDPRDPSPAVVAGALLHDVDDVVVEALLALTEPSREVGFVTVQLRHLGGALAVAPPDGGAVEAIPEPHLCAAVALAGPAFRPAFEALTEAFDEAYSPRTTFNLLGHEDIPGGPAFCAATLARLRSLKQQRDPDDVFRSNHPIGPTEP